MDAELSELERQFLELQATPSETAQKILSEANCLDLVVKFCQSQLNLFTTKSGKQFVTQTQLKTDILNCVFTKGGRVSLIDVSAETGIALDIIERVAEALCAADSKFLMLNGDILSCAYLDGIYVEINVQLQEHGQIQISDLSHKYNLPADLLREGIKPRIPHTIKGRLVSHSLQTQIFAERITAYVRGALRAASKPISLSAISNCFRLDSASVLSAASELLKSGRVEGKITSAGMFVPSKYAQTQQEEVAAFFKANGYLDISFAAERGVNTQSKFSEALQLQTVILDPSLAIAVHANVQEAALTECWLDVGPLLPSSLTPGDLEDLLEYVLSQHSCKSLLAYPPGLSSPHAAVCEAHVSSWPSPSASLQASAASSVANAGAQLGNSRSTLGKLKSKVCVCGGSVVVSLAFIKSLVAELSVSVQNAADALVLPKCELESRGGKGAKGSTATPVEPEHHLSISEKTKAEKGAKRKNKHSSPAMATEFPSDGGSCSEVSSSSANVTTSASTIERVVRRVVEDELTTHSRSDSFSPASASSAPQADVGTGPEVQSSCSGSGSPNLRRLKHLWTDLPVAAKHDLLEKHLLPALGAAYEDALRKRKKAAATIDTPNKRQKELWKEELTSKFELIQLAVKALQSLLPSVDDGKPLSAYLFKGLVTDSLDLIAQLAASNVLGETVKCNGQNRKQLVERLTKADTSLRGMGKLYSLLQSRDLSLLVDVLSEALQDVFVVSRKVDKKRVKAILCDCKTNWQKQLQALSTSPIDEDTAVDVLYCALHLSLIQSHGVILQFPKETWAIDAVWRLCAAKTVAGCTPLRSADGRREEQDDQDLQASCISRLKHLALDQKHEEEEEDKEEATVVLERKRKRETAAIAVTEFLLSAYDDRRSKAK